MADSRLGQDKNSRTPATTSWSLLSPTTWLPVWLGGTAHPSPVVMVAAKTVGVIGGNGAGRAPVPAPAPTPEVENKSSHDLDSSMVCINPMDRLKRDFTDYDNNFVKHRRRFSEIREELQLLQRQIKSSEEKHNICASVAPDARIKASAHNLQQLVTNIEKVDEPLIEHLLNDMDKPSDLSLVLGMCDDAISLIGKLDNNLIQVKAELQKARDQKSTLITIFTFLLALARLPNLIPASIAERNDENLYVTIEPITSPFFDWLDKVKIYLLKAEDKAEKFLEQQKKLLEAQQKDSSALVNQRLLASAPVSAEVTAVLPGVNNESAAPAPVLMQTREALERHLSRSPTVEIGGFGYQVEAPISPAHASLFHTGSPSPLVGSIPKSPSVLHGSELQLDHEEEARVIKHAGLATNCMV